MANPNLINQPKGNLEPEGANKKVATPLIVALIIIVISAAVYFVFFFITLTFDSRAETVQGEIDDAKLELAQLEDESADAKNFVTRLESLDEVASLQVYWSGFVDDLSARTDKGVQYLAYRGVLDESTVVVEGRAQNYAALERQLVAVNDSKYVKSAFTRNVRYDFDPETQVGSVTFDILIDLIPGLLLDEPSSFELKFELNVTDGDEATTEDSAATDTETQTNDEGGAQ